MPRKPREMLDQGYYHLIARGNNRLHIFKDEFDYNYFKDIIAKAKTKFSFKIFHYCIMSNHIHILANIEWGAQLPKLMQHLLESYSLFYRRKAGYIGHVWQGRYKSPLIQKESYLLECGRYIERNPLRAEMVQDLADYPWSSYPYYAMGAEDALVDRDPYYVLSGFTDQGRQRAYRQFVLNEHMIDQIADANSNKVLI